VVLGGDSSYEGHET